MIMKTTNDCLPATRRKDMMWLGLCAVPVLPALGFIALFCGLLLLPLFPLVGVSLLFGAQTEPREPTRPEGRGSTIHRLPATQRGRVAQAA